jgi:4-hydroxybenzoate polyprenyltransferase
MGKAKALNLSKVLHGTTASLLLLAGQMGDFHWLYWVGYTVFTGLLLYQHTLVKVDDLSKINLAFFTTNGVASVAFASFVIADLYIL